MNQIVYLYKRVHWIFYTLLSLVMAVVLLMMVHYGWWWWYIVVVDKFLVLTACSQNHRYVLQFWYLHKIGKKSIQDEEKIIQKRLSIFKRMRMLLDLDFQKLLLCVHVQTKCTCILWLYTYMSEWTWGKFCESTKYSHTCLSTFF